MGRRLALVLALLGDLQLASALERRTPWLRSAGPSKQEPGFDGSFAVRVEGKQVKVPLPWLRSAWVSSENDRLNLQYASLRSRTPSVTNNFSIHNAGGMMAGLAAFTKALTTDLDEQLARDLANCPLSTMGGANAGFNWNRSNLPAGRVWIFVNGETSMGYQFWEEAQAFMRPGEKGLIIGNWWNETHESFDSPEVSSLWVPFASTSFAERRYRTPLDLWNRTRTRFDRERKYLMAYQQSGCNDEREKFWDSLNMASAMQLNGTLGYAIGKCNGNLRLGQKADLPAGYLDGPYPFSGHMDASMGRYENFKFVFASEHGQNRHGYTTEKIANAFLAGAVPIHMGAALDQLETVFKPGSFIYASIRDKQTLQNALNLFVAAAKDEKLYESLLHRWEPVVTEASMRRFFSWHPAVWPHFGDELRQRILRAALRLCRSQAEEGQ
mmetsp:Transcript_101263/g.269247  ORF Transcript_101263/g.269247 Transcript_101263/m.269247 type:complete len:440 (-) Transcript_101263:52-1371(-)